MTQKTTKTLNPLTLALLLVVLSPASSFSQSPPVSERPAGEPPSAAPSTTPPPVVDAKACGQQRLSVAPDGKPQSGDTGQSLSQTLARSDGVICPPAGVDPDIRVPAASGSNMPVISPPGSPGGDPTVRPK